MESLSVMNDHAHENVEALTQLFGRELFARLERSGPVPLSPTWFDDRLMEWTMADQAVKVQLFRFIDVLPQLQSADETTRHLREYFEEAHTSLPGWARFGLHLLPRRGVASRLAAFTARKNAARLARRFIAGSNVEEALRAIARLRKRKLAFTVDLLGEATINEAEALQHQQEYIHLIEGLSDQVNAWPTVDQIDCEPRHITPLSPWGRGGPVFRTIRCRALMFRSSCRRCSASSIRSIRKGRARRCASGCGRCFGRHSGKAPSSTSTWSSTPTRT